MNKDTPHGLYYPQILPGNIRDYEISLMHFGNWLALMNEGLYKGYVSDTET